jgi:hypothetical protein
MVTVLRSRLCALSVAGGGDFFGGVWRLRLQHAGCKGLGVSGSVIVRFRGKVPQPPSGIPYRSPSGQNSVAGYPMRHCSRPKSCQRRVPLHDKPLASGFIETWDCLPPRMPEGPEWTYEIKLDGYRPECSSNHPLFPAVELLRRGPRGQHGADELYELFRQKPQIDEGWQMFR